MDKEFCSSLNSFLYIWFQLGRRLVKLVQGRKSFRLAEKPFLMRKYFVTSRDPNLHGHDANSILSGISRIHLH